MINIVIKVFRKSCSSLLEQHIYHFTAPQLFYHRVIYKAPDATLIPPRDPFRVLESRRTAPAELRHLRHA